MKRSELVREIAARTGLTLKQVRRVLDTLFGNRRETGLIVMALQQGQKVNLPGFGTFGVRTLRPRSMRLPQTGRTHRVPERRVPYFRPSRKLKQRLK